MPLNTADQWRDQCEGWMVERLKSDKPPASVAECQRSPEWWGIFSAFAASVFCDENIDFLNAVDEFKRSNNMDKAREIYEQFVSTSAPRQVNLYSGNLNPLQDAFEGQDNPLGSLDMFDGAYAEIQNMLDQDTYKKFLPVAESVSVELRAEAEDAGESLPPRDIGRPEQVELTRDMVQDEIVDSINQVALKDLPVGFSLNFWQIQDLVVLQGPMSDEAQPYLKWAREHADSGRAGMITMKEKGGAFSAGSISVSGATDREAFKAAIARVSKKKVIFE